MHRALLLTATIVPALALSACLECGVPNMSPPCWYQGTVGIDPPDATIFGPAGDSAIEWVRTPASKRWTWHENRGNGWAAEMTWNESGPGSFSATTSDGAHGTITAWNWQDINLYAPGGWTSSLTLADGQGTIECDADTGICNANQGTNFPLSTRPYLVAIKLRWIRPDGTIGARCEQRLRLCTLGQYEESLARLGGQRRPPPEEQAAEPQSASK